VDGVGLEGEEIVLRVVGDKRRGRGRRGRES
jgi:hypothetical protein